MGTDATEAIGAAGTVAIPSGVPVAESKEYVSEATTGWEQSSRAYPVSITSSPRVEIVSKKLSWTWTLVGAERRPGSRPNSDTWHVAGDPLLLAIRNRDVHTVPSLHTPSTT